MFRLVFRSQGPCLNTSVSLFTPTRRSVSTFDESDLVEARKWRASFNDDTIPKKHGTITFAKSSGPGGQNVNNTNSKAMLKYPLYALFAVTPKVIHPSLKASPRLNKDGNFVIQAQEERKQASNVTACWQRLTDIVQDAIDKSIPNEISEATKERIKKQAKLIKKMGIYCQCSDVPMTEEDAYVLAHKKRIQNSRHFEKVEKLLTTKKRRDYMRQLKRRGKI